MKPEDIRSAQFIDVYYPEIDGVVRTVHNYATLMNESSYSCVVAPKPPMPYTDAFSYDCLRTAALKTPLPAYQYAFSTPTQHLLDHLRENNVEILHAHSPFSLGRMAQHAGRLLGLPTVATFHSKYYDDVLTITHSHLAASAVSRFVAHFYAHADDVWAVNNGTAQTLRTYGYNGNIFVMNNGTDYVYPESPDTLRKKAIADFHIAEDKPVLLFVGHQIWQKNLKVMLDTAKLLSARGFDFEFLIVGTGYAEKEIHAYADSLGLLNNKVRFLGKISDPDVIKGIQLASDLFFFMSVYDNAPLVVREAAAMKIPSLLCRGSNSAEGVTDGVNGYLEEENPERLADKIEGIFASPEQRRLCGVKASETISVPWKAIVPKVRERYAEVIGRYRAEHKE